MKSNKTLVWDAAPRCGSRPTALTLCVTMIATPEQIAVCARFGAKPTPAEPHLKLGIALKTINQLPLCALRHRQENGTCGWYIYGGEYSTADDFFQPLHVAHISQYCPEIVPYLSLPPGWCVLLAPGYEDAWFDEGLLDDGNA